MGNINTVMDEFVQSFAVQSHLPGLRTRLEEEMADQPYQLMAIYQRSRHATSKSEKWPNRSTSALATSRYPNILAELDVSGMWINRMARCAQVSTEIMAAVMEDNGELSFAELRGLTRCFGCQADYLASPVLSMVNPTTNKGKVRLKHLKDLEQRTRGMERFLYHLRSGDVLPKLESGKSVTYAAYRWACKNLQDVLDSKAQEKARQQGTRTNALAPTGAPKGGQADLHTRLQQARKRAELQRLDRRLSEIRKCVDDVNPESPDTLMDDLYALARLSRLDLHGSLMLAMAYGQVLGCRAATGEVVA